AGRRLRADVTQNLVAVDVRHHDVEDDRVEGLDVENLQRLAAARTLDGIHALDPKPCLHELRDDRMILDDQDAGLPIGCECHGVGLLPLTNPQSTPGWQTRSAGLAPAARSRS